MSDLLLTSLEWDDWLVKEKPATTMRWSTSREFRNLQMRKCLTSNLMLQNPNMFFHNALLSEAEETI